MKKIALFLGLSAIAITSAQADLVIEQTMQNPAQPAAKMTMKVKGTKIRTDVGDQMSSIMDTETFNSVTMMHANKTIIKGDGAALKAAAATATKDAASKAVNTGKTEKVNGYNCSIWTVDISGSKVTLWATKDYPDYDSIKAELDVQAKAAGAQQNPMADIDGMVIKTVVTIGTMNITTTLDSAKKTPVADSEFVAPTDYKETKFP